MPRTVISRQYGDIADLELVDLPSTTLEPGQVRISVRAAGVNPADLKRLRGQFGRNEKALPLRLGSEVSGVVTEVTSDPQGPSGPIAIGDEVVVYPASGGFAEEVVAKGSSVLPKPSGLGWSEAAGLLLTAVTGFHLVEAAAVASGDRVIVHGASGAVGTIAVQLARLRGAQVVGTVSPGKEETVERFGAIPVHYGPGLEQRLREVLPDGADVALDTVGTDEALDASVALVPDRDRIVTVAGFSRAAELGIRLLGSGPGADPGTQLRAAARPELLRLAGEGKLVGPPIIEFPLDDVRTALTLLATGHPGGKIVLLPGRLSA